MENLKIVGMFAGLAAFFFIMVNYVQMYEGLQVLLGFSMFASLVFFFYYLAKWCGVNWKKVGKALADL